MPKFATLSDSYSRPKIELIDCFKQEKRSKETDTKGMTKRLNERRWTTCKRISLPPCIHRQTDIKTDHFQQLKSKVKNQHITSTHTHAPTCTHTHCTHSKCYSKICGTTWCIRTHNCFTSHLPGLSGLACTLKTSRKPHGMWSVDAILSK